jgi:hypothetical protein
MRHVSVWLALAFVVGCAQPPSSGGVKHDGGTGAPDFAGQPSTGNCGSANQACCMGQVCDTGLQCNPKTGGCCAATGNQCMGPGECCAGLSCTGGKCCTAIGASCQGPNDCCAGLSCNNGVCDKPAGNCGDAAKPCCSPGNTCTSGNVCVMGAMGTMGATCKACGDPGQPCCTNSVCNKGNTCNSTSNTCTGACGAANQPCCKTGMPCTDTTLSCDMTSGQCKSTSGSGTGGLNQNCNPGKPECNTPSLTCISNKCQGPQTCNTVGATCCPGNTCSGMMGLNCNTGTNKCQMAGTGCTALQKSCTQTSQCCQSVCSPTYQPDGSTAKSCCVGAGAACPDGDFDCCGGMSCVMGKCAAGADGDPCLAPDDCISKQCGSDNFCTSSAGMCGALKPVQSACTDSSQCCNGGVCEIVSGTSDPLNCCYGAGQQCQYGYDCCGSMSCETTGTTKTCICRKETESCRQSDDCCQSPTPLTCVQGNCQDTGGSTALPGQMCTTDAQCIDLNGHTYGCEGTNGSTTTCCTWDLQVRCSSAAECCGGALCDVNGWDNIHNYCCSPKGGPCRVGQDADCCGRFSGSCGSDGTCQ